MTTIFDLAMRAFLAIMLSAGGIAAMLWVWKPSRGAA